MSRLPTRLRRNPILRQLVQETQLSINDLVQPIFVTYSDKKTEIISMPGQYHIPLDIIEKEIEQLVNAGINAIILFGIPEKKDEEGLDTIDDNGIVQQALRRIKQYFPDILIITDVCFCQYTTHGHCGILDGRGLINRKKSLEYLQKQVISHANAGADLVAPSCMIDEMIKYIREALDKNEYEDIGILSYAVKYASAFYGPFRDAANSTPKHGDRRSYQIYPGNIQEALKEAKIDEDEGADIIMVKPALPYLDVIHQVKSIVQCPVAAYQVSGEYAMIKAASEKGWIDENKCILESLTGIKRAGANFIITYFAINAAQLIKDNME